MKEEVVKCDHCGKIIEGKVTTGKVLDIERDFCNDCFIIFDNYCKKFFPMKPGDKKK